MKLRALAVVTLSFLLVGCSKSEPAPEKKPDPAAAKPAAPPPPPKSAEICDAARSATKAGAEARASYATVLTLTAKGARFELESLAADKKAPPEAKAAADAAIAAVPVAEAAEVAMTACVGAVGGDLPGARKACTDADKAVADADAAIDKLAALLPPLNLKEDSGPRRALATRERTRETIGESTIVKDLAELEGCPAK